jgi:GTPase involved in cell partitioning and DNA repair
LIEVPCGTTALTDSGVVIGEVNTEKDRLVIAVGGKGGSSTNKYVGKTGQSFSVNLDLKLIADIGLIGFPNAGKSTLLSLVSRAQPKIANYPCKIFFL